MHQPSHLGKVPRSSCRASATALGVALTCPHRTPGLLCSLLSEQDFLFQQEHLCRLAPSGPAGWSSLPCPRGGVAVVHVSWHAVRWLWLFSKSVCLGSLSVWWSWFLVPTGELSRQEGGTITQKSVHSLESSDGRCWWGCWCCCWCWGWCRSLGWLFLGA